MYAMFDQMEKEKIFGWKWDNLNGRRGQYA